jgi:hypothetical protein
MTPNYEELFEECVSVVETEESKPKTARIVLTDSCIITEEMRRRIEMNAYRRQHGHR